MIPGLLLFATVAQTTLPNRFARYRNLSCHPAGGPDLHPHRSHPDHHHHLHLTLLLRSPEG
ncbi:MAG: hypothetical protein QF706_01085 [Roseibacillus sp.]|nr:hypothetical protein [Roseibacillus sp.]